MRNNSQANKDFVQPERNDFKELFSRRVSEGPVRFQTFEEYTEEMRGIEGALRELGEEL
jgi:hypothetical protein